MTFTHLREKRDGAERRRMIKNQKIFGLKYHWYLIAALGLTNYNLYTNGDGSVAWTKDTGDSIHSKTIAQTGGGNGVPVQEFSSNGFLYFGRSTTTQSERGDVICIAESEGLRIPYTNVALSSSHSECSVGDFAARSLMNAADRHFSLRY